MALSHGMNIEEIEHFGTRLQSHYAARLTDFSAEIEQMVGGTRGVWIGPDSEAFRSWWPAKRGTLRSVAQDLHGFGQSALNNAAEQRTASEEFGSRTGGPAIGSVPSRREDSFDSKGSGRADVVEALWATDDKRRAEFDEIEIRRLDNGRHVVVLPGVVDLTEKLDDFARGLATGDAVGTWYDGDQPDTLRRMEYAIGEARDADDSFQNPYALKVIELLEDAGVPQGSDVMLVGHSFGAYTAMELAGNEYFNSSDGSSAGYHVNVTHVVAAGGDTSFKLAEVPPETNALVLNNRYDLAFIAEDPLQADFQPVHDGHVNIEFYGQKPWQGGGHLPSGYIEWLENAHDRPELNSWLDGAGDLYSSGGTAYSVKVQDFQ